MSRLLQQDFSSGMFRSVSSELIPPNGAWDISNGLLTQDGAIFRRGGTEYRSTTDVGGLPTVLWDGVLDTGGQQTIIARNGGLFRMSGLGVLTSLGGAGVAGVGRGVAYEGVLYLPGGVTYDGATVGTAAKVGDFYAVVANRLLVASGDRIDFSGIGTPGTFGATDFHRIPGGVTILGMHGLRDAAAVFTTDGVWIISNLAFELTDADGNVQHRLDHYSSEIVLWGDGGLAAWQGGLVVPGTEGVWQLNLGIASEAPEAFVPLSGSIQNLYQDYVRSGFTPGGAVVHGHHYLLPILFGVDVIDMLACRLDVGIRLADGSTGRPWTHLSGFGAQASVLARRVLGSRKPELLAGHMGGRVMEATWLAPSASSDSDADDSAYQWQVTSRAIATGSFVPNTVTKMRASYQLQDAAGVDPTIEAFAILSPIATAGTKWGQFRWGTGEWSPGGEGAIPVGDLIGVAPEDAAGTHPFTWWVRRKTRYLQVRLRCRSTASWLSLRALELFVREDGRL